MNKAAILHRPFTSDAQAVSESEIIIRFRAGKGDLEKVLLYFGDRVCQENPIKMCQLEMGKIGSDFTHDIFEARFLSEYPRICYYFGLWENGKEIYYLYKEFREEAEVNRSLYYQIPFILRDEIHNPPEAFKSEIMYQIFPDSFASKPEGFTLDSGENSVACKNSKFGGTLKGIAESLNYLVDLGITSIYLNPVFKSMSWHKYDIVDYMDIDSFLGDKNDFHALVDGAHSKGIKVILDGVFNHCGSDFPQFLDVREKGRASRYWDWFYRLEEPVLFQDPPNYDCFAYVKEMPKMNTRNPEVVEYFCKVGTYWIREFGIDGWRLDVANEVDHEFWKSFRKAVKEVDSNVVLIGEVWEDAEPWLMGDEFDSTMNYRFTEIALDAFANGISTPDEVDNRLNYMLTRYSANFTSCQMNFLDTHDVPRFLSHADNSVDCLKAAAAFLFSIPGVPSIYYGDELGVFGNTEIEYRKPMPWGEKEKSRLFQYWRKLIALRKRYSDVFQGQRRRVAIAGSDSVYAVIANSGKESIISIFNLSGNVVDITVPGFYGNIGKELLLDEPCGKSANHINLPPWGVSFRLI